MKLTSDVKLLIQRSHYEVNTIEPRKIIATKKKTNFTGFYTEDDPKVAKSEWFLEFASQKNILWQAFMS